EPIANVAAAGRTEQRVDQRVHHGITVRMAGQPARMRDLNAAEPQRDPGGKGVNVQARANAHHRSSASRVRASAKSSGVVTLKARSSPLKTATLTPSCSTRAASSV